MDKTEKKKLVEEILDAIDKKETHKCKSKPVNIKDELDNVIQKDIAGNLIGTTTIVDNHIYVRLGACDSTTMNVLKQFMKKHFCEYEIVNINKYKKPMPTITDGIEIVFKVQKGC